MAHDRVVAVLGAGNMAGAIAQTLATIPDVELRLTTQRSTPAWAVGLPHVTHVAAAEAPGANASAVRGADAVILGVKPGDIVALAREVGPELRSDALVISVAGGVRIADVAAVLAPGAAVVRTMPNTPVAVGRGVTAFAVAPAAPEGTAARVKGLLGPTGVVEELDESLIDGFSAVVGSGPAYVYLVIEALQEALVAQGLSDQQASRMVPGMVGGAISYLEATGRDPGDLREEVTSPGGSTAAALATFAERGVAQALRDGVAAAVERTRELGNG